MFQSAFLRKIGGFPPIDLGDEFYLMEKAILHHGRISYLPRCDVKALVHRETSGCRAGRERSVGKISCLRHKKEALDGYEPQRTKTDLHETPYGAGIYVSEKPTVSGIYQRGCTGIFLCSVDVCGDGAEKKIKDRAVCGKK